MNWNTNFFNFVTTTSEEGRFVGLSKMYFLQFGFRGSNNGNCDTFTILQIFDLDYALTFAANVTIFFFLVPTPNSPNKELTVGGRHQKENPYLELSLMSVIVYSHSLEHSHTIFCQPCATAATTMLADSFFMLTCCFDIFVPVRHFHKLTVLSSYEILFHNFCQNYSICTI